MTSQSGHEVMQNNKIRKICANTKSTGLKFCSYSVPDLYLAKMKNALFVAPEFNRLSYACAV